MTSILPFESLGEDVAVEDELATVSGTFLARLDDVQKKLPKCEPLRPRDNVCNAAVIVSVAIDEGPFTEKVNRLAVDSDIITLSQSE
jgi:hypothetical protein